MEKCLAALLVPARVSVALPSKQVSHTPGMADAGNDDDDDDDDHEEEDDEAELALGTSAGTGCSWPTLS